jgi:plasmid stabilization system protein ParE
MVAETPRLTVVLAPAAIEELVGVWQWNAERYSPTHANTYVEYLKTTIDGLAATFTRGKLVEGRPDLRFILVRRRAKGHGHVVVYRFNRARIDVLHVFHSAQDWPGKLKFE